MFMDTQKYYRPTFGFSTLQALCQRPVKISTNHPLPNRKARYD
jgi:hypothetical protein